MRRPSTQTILFFVGLAVVLFLLGFLVKEGFQSTQQMFDKVVAERGAEVTSMTDECLSRTSCGSCLEPRRIISEESISTTECAKKPGAYYDAAKNKCVTYKFGNCGWCPNAEGAGKGKCVPKIVSSSVSGTPAYPLVPRAKGVGDGVAVGDPIYKCPIAEFVSQAEMCPEFSCATIKDCAECSTSSACGWCKGSSTCVARKARGGDEPAAGKDGVSLCPVGSDGMQQFVTKGVACPKKACGDIKDCVKCAMTDGCGFCSASGKCLKIDSDGGLPDEKMEDCLDEKGEDIGPVISPTQCPGMAAAGLAPLGGEKPSDAQLALIQNNLLGLGGAADGQRLEQSVADLGYGAVSPPKGRTDVSAPGISRPLGSSGARPTVPSAAGVRGLDEPGPFETYVQMLVKSELAAQGVPTAEPFAGAAGRLDDVVGNASLYFKAEGEKLADEYDPAAKTRRLQG